MFKLKDEVKDKITGFTGIITAKAKYVTEETRYLVESIDNTNRPVEWWFNESRLTKIKED